MWRNERGFTLVELIVVVIIIGIIAAVALPRFMGQADTARENATLAELRSMKAVVEIFYAEEGRLPVADTGVATGPGVTIDTVMQAGGINWTGVAGGIENPWGFHYTYWVGTVPDRYIIATASDGSPEGTADDTFYVTDKQAPANAGEVEVNVDVGTGGYQITGAVPSTTM